MGREKMDSRFRGKTEGEDRRWGGQPQGIAPTREGRMGRGWSYQKEVLELWNQRPK